MELDLKCTEINFEERLNAIVITVTLSVCHFLPNIIQAIIRFMKKV